MSRVQVQAEDLFFLDSIGDRKPPAKQVVYDADIQKELEAMNLSSDSESSIDSSDSDDSDSTQDEEAPLINLPKHACSYCTIHDPLCVAKCNHCSKWFCNSKKGTIASHIVNHLVKSGHKEVSLHSDSPVGDAILECYNCGCNNIFLLGYVQSKSESVVVLLCRQPCAMNSPKGMDWDIESWSPLISERSILPWLVQMPNEKLEARARKLDVGKIQKLEGFWKSGVENCTLDEIDVREREDVLEPTKTVYEDVFDFKATMNPLIVSEAKVQKEAKESQVSFECSL